MRVPGSKSIHICTLYTCDVLEHCCVHWDLVGEATLHGISHLGPMIQPGMGTDSTFMMLLCSNGTDEVY